MTSNVKSSIVKLEANELNNLVTEVRETVAVKQFTTVDLWNIQKGRKTENLSKRPMLSRRNTIL